MCSLDIPPVWLQEDLPVRLLGLCCPLDPHVGCSLSGLGSTFLQTTTLTPLQQQHQQETQQPHTFRSLQFQLQEVKPCVPERLQCCNNLLASLTGHKLQLQPTIHHHPVFIIIDNTKKGKYTFHQSLDSNNQFNTLPGAVRVCVKVLREESHSLQCRGSQGVHQIWFICLQQVTEVGWWGRGGISCSLVIPPPSPNKNRNNKKQQSTLQTTQPYLLSLINIRLISCYFVMPPPIQFRSPK